MPTLTVASAVADRSLVALATVKAELGITDTTNDTLLTRWIKELSDNVCEVCAVAPDQMGRRTFLTEAVTISYRSQEVPDVLDPAPLILPWRAPLDIDTVTVDGTSLTVADDVELEPMAGLLWRLSSSGCRTRWERGRVVITGSGGWLQGDMPAALSSAVTDAVRYRWFAHTRGDGDPLLRSYENPDVEKMAWMDADKLETVNGLPAAVVGRLAPYTNMVIG
ncbi:hypothetical protein ACJ41P_10585 [Azospirillum argentinense]|uniref:Phage gp6-like head-tail connector protein n=1 Tax=Azospirillum argentinense TaxID=2970906 RepID=A0ABW8V8I5_9PROT